MADSPFHLSFPAFDDPILKRFRAKVAKAEEYTELLIGCGSNHKKAFSINGTPKDWQALMTLDMNPNHKPDVVHDLEVLPYPFEDDSFNEIHAYEILEHTGQQGDWRFFFDQFSEFWRILRPGGYLVATVPRWDGEWAYGDPSHKRVINSATLTFLDQEQYVKQVGKTPMSDFRFCYKADFKVRHAEYGLQFFHFILQANKEIT